MKDRTILFFERIIAAVVGNIIGFAVIRFLFL